ncbi:Hsp70 family protein [soil metagenome]
MSATGTYQLGVDLGTTYTAAAVARDGQCKMVGLGNRSAAIPSVVHVSADGSVRAGDAADRRGPTEPDRVAREFKRRLGDPTPLLLGGTPYAAEAVLGALLDAVVAKVTTLEGGPPNHLTVTHPANWGPYKQELFDQCLRAAGIDAASTVTEPEAAAISYAANERVEPGSLVAVYDLGGGTFDVAILRKTTDGFSILGRPEGIERLGGIDFDEAVVGHVRAALGGALDRLDVNDPAVLSALTRLRRECTEAKEALSSDAEVTIPVLLPGVQTDVRLTRGEFERMIRPTLDATIDAMRRALVAAAVEPQQISTVLLVGGSSRIPLVAELVSQAFGRPIAVDAHPKHAIALGAARAAALAADDAMQVPGDAQVLAFSTTADVAVDRQPWTDETTDLRAPAAAGAAVAGADVAAADVAPSSGQRHRQWDRRPYDDAPSEMPAWVGTPRKERKSRRKLWTGVVAFVALSVLTIGAGAFMTSDPPSEARGDTPATRGTPATEWFGDWSGDDTDPDAASDAPIAASDLSETDADGGGGQNGSGDGGDDATGDAGAADSDTGAKKAKTKDPGTSGSGTDPGGSTGGPDPDPDPDPGPDPTPTPTPTPTPAPTTEPPKDPPSETPGGGTGAQDTGVSQQGASEDPLNTGTPTQS